MVYILDCTAHIELYDICTEHGRLHTFHTFYAHCILGAGIPGSIMQVEPFPDINFSPFDEYTAMARFVLQGSFEAR